MFVRRLTAVVVCLAAFCASTYTAQGEDASSYPSRVIEIVVPLPAGGPNDIVARILSDELQSALKARLVVANKPGAGSVLGTQFVAQAKPDGYTLLLTSNGFAVNPITNANARYDPLKSFTPIAFVASGPQVLVVRRSLPVRDVKELVAYSKQQKGGVKFASAGVGTLPHLSFLLFQQKTGFDSTHVGFRGAGPALIDLVGGHVDAMWVGSAAALPYVQSGELKALAVSSGKRVKNIPEVPTAQESGIEGFEVINLVWLIAPHGTPHPIVNKLAEVVKDAVTKRSFHIALEKLGYVGEGSGPDSTAQLIRREIELWSNVAKKAGISN